MPCELLAIHSPKRVPKMPKVGKKPEPRKVVMPDLIRHPEEIEFTGFRFSPE
jgi:hypothetical protein